MVLKHFGFIFQAKEKELPFTARFYYFILLFDGETNQIKYPTSAQTRGETENIKHFAESHQHLRRLCAVIAFKTLRATISVASSEDVLIKDAAIRDK